MSDGGWCGASSCSLADRARTWEAKDRVLAYSGPMSLLVVFVVWLVLYLVGYGLMLWPLVPGDLWSALRESGSSVFTLGVASSVRPGRRLSTSSPAPPG